MQERLYLQGGSRIEFPSLLSLAGRQDCPSRNCRPRCTTVATSCTAGTHSVTTAILLPILPKRLATAATFPWLLRWGVTDPATTTSILTLAVSDSAAVGKSTITVTGTF